MQYRTYFPVDQIAGHDGHTAGVVYYRNNGLDCCRKHVVPANPQTSEQVAIRSLLTQASQAFKDITDAERASWAVYAAAHPETYLDSEFTLQEMAAYVKINVIRLIDSAAISDTAPSVDAGFTATALGSISYATGTTTFEVQVTHNGTNGVGYWKVELTGTLASAQRNPRKSDWRLGKGIHADSIVGVTTSPQTIQINPPIFTWANNDWMAVRVTALSDDYSPGAITTTKVQITVT